MRFAFWPRHSDWIATSPEAGGPWGGAQSMALEPPGRFDECIAEPMTSSRPDASGAEPAAPTGGTEQARPS